jgi:hypothetical protein
VHTDEVSQGLGLPSVFGHGMFTADLGKGSPISSVSATRAQGALHQADLAG